MEEPPGQTVVPGPRIAPEQSTTRAMIGIFCRDHEVHCYSANRRHRIKEVMRYAGPGMLLQHPVLALFHVVRFMFFSPPHLRLPHDCGFGGGQMGFELRWFWGN